MLAKLMLSSGEKTILILSIIVIVCTIVFKSKRENPDLTEDELVDIQLYNKLSEEGKLLHKLVELQKINNRRVNGILWYFLAGSIFAVIIFLIDVI